jgi:hypothetical protein
MNGLEIIGRITLFSLATVCALVVMQCLRTGVFRERFGDDRRRSERPLAYWASVAVWGMLGLFFLLMSISELP